MPGENRNSLLIRAVNDRIRDVNDPGGDSGPVGFLCECGDIDCQGALEITIADYEAVRSTRGRFVLLAGHESQAQEVLARMNGYVVVEETSSE
jgi:hypothetical protein